MYNLSLHIEYLLLHHDCVVVPGLGAFINVRHAARFDSVRRVWLPMTREVRFNGALSHDDGLLANSYARKNSVSFAEGRELLRRDTMQLREALESDGEITLGHLGILRLEEETVSFQPQQSAAQTARFMGYTAAPVFRQAPQVPLPLLPRQRILPRKLLHPLHRPSGRLHRWLRLPQSWKATIPTRLLKLCLRRSANRVCSTPTATTT